MARPLGRLLLETRLGTGGAGEVWRATMPLARGRLPVAVKLLTRASDPDRLGERLKDEVRAVARFRHPHIIRVFDAGVVTAQEAAEGGVAAGTPYLVMELCSGGPLRQVARWDEVVALATALLGALAHAHARGVLHRDLKPANVLLADDQDLRPGPKLADWDIAWAMDASDRSRAGTLAYMAPEQITGRWADWSPATDLYALGCVIWELIAHHRPFDAATPEAWAEAHLRHSPRRLEPAVPVPPGTEAWLRRLLQKHPEDRFAHAVDALRALRALGGAEGAATPGPLPQDATVTTSSLPVAAALAPPRASGAPVDRPELPAAWPPEPADPPLMELGVSAFGEGLVGARPPPLVGRDDEQRALWDALLAVERERKGAFVLLRGAPGSGVSRLAAALCEVAAEHGAVALRATHDAVPVPTDGLAGLLARHLRCLGERAEVAHDRIARIGLDAHDTLGLTEMVSPSGALAFEGPEHRYAIVGRLVERIAQTRPVVTWLDDVHRGHDALAFAAHLARTAAPVLVVLTMPDDAERPRIPGLRTLDLGPLPATAMARLLRETLDLSGELAQRIEDRAAGNPGYAVALVQGLALEGVLEPSATGYRLPPGRAVALPADALAAWHARVEAVPGDRAAIELLAAGGTSVLALEWARAREAAGVSDRDLDPWREARLLHRDRQGLAFASAMVRDAVAARARRGARDHAVWARICEESGALDRAALHHLQAGDAGRASALLDRALHARLGHPRGLLDLLDAFEQLPSSDEEADARRLTRGEVLSNLGHYDAALDLAREVLDRGAPAQHPAAHHLIGRVYRKLGRLGGAVPHLEAAIAGFAAQGVRIREGKCWLALGHIERLRGDLDAAERCFERVLALDQTRLTVAWVEHALGTLSGARSDPEATARHAQRALELFEQEGVLGGVAHALIGLAEAARAHGALDRAAELYERALGIYERIGSDGRFVARLNLAQTLLVAGHPTRARPAFEQSRREMAARGRKMLVAGAELGLAWCAALDDRSEARASHLDAAIALLDETGAVDPDLAALAEGAAAASRAAGGVVDADRAEAIARDQRARLRRS